MRNIKRIISIILTLSLIIVSSNLLWTEAFAESNSEKLWVCDESEVNKYGFEEAVTGQFKQSDSKMILSTSGGRIFKKFDKPLSYESEPVMFEYNFELKNNKSYFEMYFITQEDVTHWLNSFALQVDASKELFQVRRRAAAYDNESRTVKVGEKHNVKILFDGKRGMALMYLDNELLAKRHFEAYNHLSPRFPNGFTIVPSRAPTEFDSFSLKKADYRMADELSELEFVDEDYYQPFIIKHKELGVLGNIFKSLSEQKMKLSFTSIDKTAYTGTFEFSARNEETGEEYWKETRAFDFSDVSKPYEVEINKTTGTYGLHRLYIVAKDESGNIIMRQNIPFSVINAVGEGVKNERLGFTMHVGGNFNSPVEGADNVEGGSLEKQFELMNNIGIRILRPSFDRTTFNEEGAISERTKTLLELSNENNIDIVVNILDFSADSVGNVPEEKQEWIRSIVKTTKDYDCVKLYEIGNEPEYSGPVPYDNFNNYTKRITEIIKEESPNAVVSGWGGGGSNLEYMEECMDRGMDGKILDMLTFHPYTCPGSPEKDGLENKMKKARMLADRTGIKRVGISETGYPTSGHPNSLPADRGRDVTEDWQAVGNTRILLLADVYGLVDFVTFYVLCDTPAGKSITDEPRNWDESRFGFVRSHVPEDEVMYSAKPVYVAMANYSSMLAGGKFKQEIPKRDENDSTRGYIFTRSNGKNCTVLYNDDGLDKKRDLRLASYRIDSPSVNVVDFYGNEKTVYPVDGVYTFLLSDKLTYILGDYTSVERVDNYFELSDTEIPIVSGDMNTLTIKTQANNTLNVNVLTSGSVKISNNVDKIENGKADIVVADSDGNVEGKVYITVTDAENRLIAEFTVPTYKAEPAEIVFSVLPYEGDVNHWRAEVAVTNRSGKDSIKGNIVFKSPNELTKKVSAVKLDEIKPKDTGVARFFVPDTLTNGRTMKFTAELCLDNGKVISFGGESDAHYINYAQRTPKIDGQFSLDEWKGSMPLVINRKEQSFITIDGTAWWGGENDLSAVGYPMWDEEYFYLAVVVEDNIQHENKNGTFWASDSIQFGIADKKGSSGFTEGAIAQIDGKAQFKFFNTFKNRSTTDVGDSEYKIMRNGTQTVYELKCPWRLLVEDMFRVKEYSSIAFSFLVNDNDGDLDDGSGGVSDGRLGFMEYYIEDGRAGIGTSKDTKLFREFQLVNIR